MPSEGEVFTINWRVVGHANPAHICYYRQEIDVFLHQWPEGEWALMVDQNWLDEQDEWHREYARAYVDGTSVDPDDVYDHPRIDPT